MRVRVRAPPRVTGTPAARASRAAAAVPQLRPRPGPGPARPPPHMELSAIGEQVFAVESIRKKRVRKVRLPGGGPRTPEVASGLQHHPLQAGARGTWGWGEVRQLCAAGPLSPAGASVSLPPCGASRIKVVGASCWGQLSPPQLRRGSGRIGIPSAVLPHLLFILNMGRQAQVDLPGALVSELGLELGTVDS